MNGQTKAGVPEKLSIVALRLTNFVINFAFLDHFSKKLEFVEFKQCRDAGFRLPEELVGHTTVRVCQRDGSEREFVRSGRIKVGLVDTEGWGAFPSGR